MQRRRQSGVSTASPPSPRLKPGVTVHQAQAQLDAIAARIGEQYPADAAGWGAAVVPLREETVGDVQKPLLMLLGSVAFVLLIACANVANLMLARMIDRRKVDESGQGEDRCNQLRRN